MAIYDGVKDFVSELGMIRPQMPGVVTESDRTKIADRAAEFERMASGGRGFVSRDEVLAKIESKARERGIDFSSGTMAEVLPADHEDNPTGSPISRGALFLAEQYARVLQKNREGLAAGMPVREIVDAESGRAEPVLSPPEAALTGRARGMTGSYSGRLGGIAGEAPHPDDPISLAAGTMGEMTGMLRAVHPLAAKMGAGAAASGARNIGANAAAGLIYGTAGDNGGIMDRLKTGGLDAVIFSAVTGLPAGITAAASKLGGPTAGLVAESLMGSVPGKGLYDAALFTGMDYAFHPDSPLKDRIARVVGGVMGAGAAGREASGRAAAAGQGARLREAAIRAVEKQAAESAAAELARAEAAGKEPASAGPEPISTEPAPEPVKVRRKDLRPPKEYDRRGMPAIEGEVPAPALTKADAKRVKELLLEPTPEPAPEPAPEPPIYPMFPEAARVESILPQRMLHPEPVPSPGGPRQTVSEGPLDPLTRTAPQTLPDVEPAGVRRPYMTKAAATREGKVAARLMVDTPPPKDTGRPMPQMSQADAKNMPEKIASAGTSDFTLDMMGGQQAYEALRGLAKSAMPALKSAVDPVRRKMGAALDDAIRDGLDRVLPPDGVNQARLMLDYLEGRKTKEQMVEEFVALASRGELAGAVSPEVQARIRQNMISENQARAARGEDTKAVTAEAVWARALAASAAPEVRAAIDRGEFKGIGANVMVDKRRTIQAVDDGQLSGPITRFTQRVGEVAEMVDVVMAREFAGEMDAVFEKYGVTKGTPEAVAIGRLIKAASDAGVADVAQVMNDQSVQPYLQKVGNPVDTINAAREYGKLMENHWTLRDKMHRAYTGEGIGKIKGPYMQEIEHRVSAWEALKDPIGRGRKMLEQRTSPTRPSPDHDRARYSPQEALSSRQRRRSGKIDPEELEYDIVKLGENYARDTARTLAHQIPLASSKSISEYMNSRAYEMDKLARDARKRGDDAEVERLTAEKKNLERSSETLDKVMQLAYNDIPFGVVGAVQKALMGNRVGQTAYNVAAFNKQIFNRVRYTFNVPFMVLRQWTSIGLLGSFPEVKPSDFRDAMYMMLSPQAGEIYRNTYVGWAKSLDMGGIYKEGSDAGMTRSVRIRPGTAERIANKSERVINMPTNFVEQMTGRYAVALGDIIAQRMGLTGRVRQDFLSDIISKTQSEYHATSRSQVVRDPLLNFLVPAQSFAVESLNNMREAGSDNVGVNFYNTGGQKAGAIARAITMMMLTNAVYQVVNRKDESFGKWLARSAWEDVQSYVPGSGLITAEGPSGGLLYPASVKQSVFDMIGDVSDGDIDKAMNEIIKTWVPGGGQLSRIQMANVMLERGVITEDELPWAQLMGWWTTESGRKYLKKNYGDGGEEATPASEAFGGREMPGRRAPGTGRRQPGGGRPFQPRTN